MEESKRKKSKWGAITQKMLSFRVDLDVLEMLNKEPKKGRVINNLLRAHYGLPSAHPDDDENPDERQLEDTMP